jgi:polysaccharide export outer membrane protein
MPTLLAAALALALAAPGVVALARTGAGDGHLAAELWASAGALTQARGSGAAQAKPPATASKPGPPATKPPAPGMGRPTPGAVATEDPTYVIGPEDQLGVLFWRDAEMSGDVTVRPDGMITLPLVRDVKAAGLTPSQLADKIQEAAREYVQDASVTVVVRQINSRKVFITGEVANPGAYPMGASSMTVMQLIAVAGGLTEWAESDRITIMRVEGGKSRVFPFNYKDVARGKKAEQNILLRPGDTVVVPAR